MTHCPYDVPGFHLTYGTQQLLYTAKDTPDEFFRETFIDPDLFVKRMAREYSHTGAYVKYASGFEYEFSQLFPPK